MNVFYPFFREHIHYSKELEEGILGACLLEKEAFGRTFGLIEKENFYFEGHQLIYDTIAELYNSGFPIDILTVVDYLVNKQNKIEIDGTNVPYFVTRITNHVVSSAHIEYHSIIVRRMWMERELKKLTQGAVLLEGDVKEQIDQLNKSIQKINQSAYKNDWSDMSQLVYDLMSHQEEMSKTQGMGITTGIRSLDRENGGFFPGQMIVIGARPSVGKSAFMGQMAIAMAKSGVSVGIVSLEMNNNEIAARLSSLHTQDDFRTIFRNLYHDENHKTKWYDKMRSFVNESIYVTDVTGVNMIDIKAKAQKLQYQIKKQNPDKKMVLMIDYLQLVSAENDQKNRTRENEVSKISRGCKLIGKELGIPTILLCQLNRAVTHRVGQNRYPMLSDLRESGSIEQDADIVMFIHRDWLLGEEYMKDENGKSTENKADLIVRKWRNGKSNLHIPMTFDAPRMMFKQTENIDQWQPEAVDFTGDNPF